MKKILTLLLILALSLTVLVGCDVLANLGLNFGEQPDQTPDAGDETPDETPAVDADLQGAYDYVHQLTKTISEKTGASYSLVGTVVRGDKVFTVNWTVSDDRVVLTTDDNGKVTVTVPEPLEDIPYDLTFTIYNEKGESLSRTYKHVVPKFAYTTYAQYAAAAKGEAVVVTGIVSGVISKTTGSSAYGLYIQDLNNEGGYYVWNLTDDPHGVIEVGMTVKVKGNKDLYNGTYEVVSPSVEILDTTIKAVEPVDFTELYLGATTLNDNALVGKQGMLVTLKGVTILEAGDNGYYYFQLGELKTYLRISSSNNPTTKEALENIKTVHAANYGNTADVTGIISIYNGNFYLSPVSADAFSNVQVPERTDAEKVEMELGLIKLDSKVTADKVITLPANGTNYSDVVFTWACESEHAVLADGKLTLTVPDSKATVTVTVTATCGEATETQTFEITLSKEVIALEEALAIGAAQEHNVYTADKYLIAGIITGLYGTSEENALKYGNFVITDENGNTLVVYGLYSADGSVRYDAMESKPVIGDYIVVLGTLGQYNGTVQTKNAWLVSYTVETSIPSASEIGVANPSYTTEKYMITGVISALYGTNQESALKYGNVIIKDADGNEFIVYGMYSSTGATRYDAMTYKPTIGDTITVLGTLGSYNGTAQMKNGWLIACEKGATTPDTPVDPDPEEPTPDTPVEGENVTANVVFADLGWTNSTLYESVEIDANVTASVFGTAVGEYGRNTGKFYTNGNNWRVYQSETGTLTITANNGAVIVSVKVTYEGYNTGTLTLNGEAVESDAVVTVNATSVTFGVGNTTTATNGQARVTAIEVVYAGGSAVEPKPEEPTPEEPTPDEDGYVTMTVAEALSAAADTKVKITGTVVSMYETWSSYGNCSPYIQDESGKKILIFRTTTQVNVGDVITVEGVITVYNSTNQIAQGTSTVTIDVAHVCSSFNDATCTAPKTCTLCGKTEGSVIAHNYVDGACTMCGAQEGVVLTAKELSFADKANRTVFTTSQQVWVQNGVTLTNDQAASTSSVADYAKPARFYKSSKLTLECAGMLKIEFVCNSASYATALVNSLGTVAGATVSANGSTVTVTFSEAVDTFVIASLSGGQVRMDSLKVYVEA